MHIPFASMPDDSRLWIYQSERKFTPQEISIISDALLSFTEQWSAHGDPLMTSFDIRLDQFIVLAANEKHVPASGCSIDGAVRTIKGLGERLDINFFDRTAIAFYRDNAVTIIPMAALRKHFSDGMLNRDSDFINLLVNTKGDLEHEFVQPVSQTWLRRYLPAENVTD